MNFFGSSSSIEDFEVNFNAEGWGPIGGKKILAFEEVPYAHFDKKDKCGRPADFGLNQPQHPRAPRYRRDEGAGNADFVYRHDAQEDSTFQLVDSTKAVSKKTNAPKRTWTQQGRTAGGRGGRGGRGAGGRGEPFVQFRGRKGAAGGRGAGRGGFRKHDRKVDRIPSLSVLADWELVEEFDLGQLLKLVANPPKVEDLAWCGCLDHYDDAYDKLTVRTAKPLRRIENKIFYGHVTTTEDPMMDKYVAEGGGVVFATDAILAQLMAAPRSVFSWDLVIEKANGMIFIDKREGSNFDYLTVSETAREPPAVSEEMEEYNHPMQLSLEATQINQNFSQQILKDDRDLRKTFEANPFHNEEYATEGAEPASIAYRYRKFTLGQHVLIARCELHGWLKKRDEDLLLTAYALNEWDSKYSDGVVWRQKIDTQRGAVLATELKNNSCKLAKWTAQSIVAGADQMRVGYVSRVTPKDAADHVILATQAFKPKELATQINLSLTNIWGIVKMITEMALSKEDGKYVLLKDPNKPTLRLYAVPINTFDDEEEGDGEEGELAAADGEDAAVAAGAVVVEAEVEEDNGPAVA